MVFRYFKTPTSLIQTTEYGIRQARSSWSFFAN
jgi:hypothetical protein